MTTGCSETQTPCAWPSRWSQRTRNRAPAVLSGGKNTHAPFESQLERLEPPNPNETVTSEATDPNGSEKQGKRVEQQTPTRSSI